jgi:hypothetical protein
MFTDSSSGEAQHIHWRSDLSPLFPLLSTAQAPKFEFRAADGRAEARLSFVTREHAIGHPGTRPHCADRSTGLQIATGIKNV